MSKQFRVTSDKITVTGFRNQSRDFLYQSCLLKRIRNQNYPVFQSELFCKNNRLLSLEKKSQSADDIIAKTKNCCKQIKTKKLNLNLPPSQSSFLPRQKRFQTQFSNSSSKKSLNKILTRACILRNQRKKQKFLLNKPLFSSTIENQQKNPQLKGQVKYLFPRRQLMQNFNSKAKQKLNDQSSKMFFLIKKKKFPFNRSHVQNNEIQKKIDAWDFFQDEFNQF